MTLVSIFQPAGVQLYLICTAAFGGITTFILRKPGFREWWGMAPLPTKEAQEMWAKVAKGEIPLSEVITKDGKMKSFAPKEAPVIQQTIKYQPPAATAVKGSRRSAPTKQRLQQNRGLTIKSGSTIPAHLAVPSAHQQVDPQLADRDHDFDTPPTGFFNRVDWFARNYRPKYLFMGVKLWMARTLGGEDVRAQLLGKKKDIAKMKAEDYEFRRKERFRNN
jgi:YidC/Oxa1 family membrane protein insertase